MDKILLLGINGFTGKHFQKYILRNQLLSQYDFVGVDKIVETDSPIRCIEIDLVGSGEVEHLISTEMPDFIFNFAGLFGAENYNDLFQVNSDLPRRILATIADNNIGVKKILLIGSAGRIWCTLYIARAGRASLEPDQSIWTYKGNSGLLCSILFHELPC